MVPWPLIDAECALNHLSSIILEMMVRSFCDEKIDEIRSLSDALLSIQISDTKESSFCIPSSMVI